MFIDSHCHLNFPQYDSDREKIINQSHADGIVYFLDIGTEEENWTKSLALSAKYNFIYSGLGIHPHEADKANDHWWKQLKALLSNKKVVAVGETGLDFYRNLSSPESQKKVFRQQIRLAKEFKKPLIIHIRDAYSEAITIIKEENSKDCGGVIHCFSGDLEKANMLLADGFFISFAGQITFPVKKGQTDIYSELIKNIPIEKILIETDAPYLAPVPKRGQRNEPCFVRYTAQKIAEVKGLSLEDVARITTLNTKKLFSIEESADKGMNHAVHTGGKIAYTIRNSLYLNITNQCSNTCTFCIRYRSDFVKGHNLKLNKEPGLEAILSELKDANKFKEVVFCGYGEPLMRLDIVKEVSKILKEKGVFVRIDTNGHANLIHKRNILPELKGLIDSISISLNAENEEKYFRICQPVSGKNTFEKVIEFIKEAKKYIPEVNISVVDIPEINVDKCRLLAEKLGVGFRLRKYDEVG